MAKPQPIAIVTQPAFSDFVLPKTFAATPAFPNNTRMKVPRNSPNICNVIALPYFSISIFSNCSFIASKVAPASKRALAV